jgi:hypothetical protein
LVYCEKVTIVPSNQFVVRRCIYNAMQLKPEWYGWYGRDLKG